MKKSLLSLVILINGLAFGQQDLYALTGKNTETIIFQDFRALDSKKGITTKTFLSDLDVPKVISANQGSEITEDKKTYHHAQAPQIATLAIDGRGNLVYMPLFSSNIYVLDTKTKDITLIENPLAAPKACDLNSQFSRMATDKNGNVYALSNAGTQFLKISYKSGKYTVENLGIVTDDSGNGVNLLTKRETGFGGDMIADPDGNFYVFSASGNVFKLIAEQMKIKYLGKIKGLPQNYSLNGAAADQDGNVILASSKGGVLNKLNMKTLHAEPMQSNMNLPIYDLASPYLLKGKNQVASMVKNDIYPTNVTEKYVNIRLINPQKEKATVKVYNSAGVLILTQNLITGSEVSEQRVELGNLISGVYLVDVSGENGKKLVSKKIMVK